MSKIVVVSPHLDDAVLSLYGALAPAATVVTVFAGVPPEGTLGPWDAGSGATDSSARIRERHEEDRLALARSGAAHVHLELGDRQYVALGAMPKVTVDSVMAVLRPHLDGAEIVYAPAGVSAWSSNPLRRYRRRRRPSDHLIVRDATLAVRPDARLYAELPYALSRDRGFVAPPDVRRRKPDEHRASLEPALAAEKIESVRCYATQIAPLEEVFGDFVTAEALGTEVWWGDAE